MVLEEINAEWLMNRPYVALALGFIYAIIGYVLATLFFFEKNASVAMLFITTLFIVPTFVGVLTKEEQEESKKKELGLWSFLKNHRTIVETYIFIFIGVFLGFVLLGFLAGDRAPIVFEFQLEFLSTREGLTITLLDNFFEVKQNPILHSAMGILQNNLSVMLICFFLSAVFGAGALFLIVLNSSVFAIFGVLMLRYLMTDFWRSVKVIATFGLHLVPEISGFILAAIAGGVLSKALLSESFGSDGFKNVVRDAVYLFLAASILILFAAFIEIYVTAPLFQGF